MRTSLGIGVVAAAVLFAVLARMEANAQQGGARPPAVAPSHRVVACYFHRTIRCPTCKKISAYIEEAVQTGFPRELKDGRVAMVLIDFQDPRNEAYTRTFKVTGPILVLVDVHDGKVTAWKPVPKVWSLVGKKAEFLNYVQAEIHSYLDENQVGLRQSASAR